MGHSNSAIPAKRTSFSNDYRQPRFTNLVEGGREALWLKDIEGRWWWWTWDNYLNTGNPRVNNVVKHNDGANGLFFSGVVEWYEREEWLNDVSGNMWDRKRSPIGFFE